jgi:hypothetical protein
MKDLHKTTLLNDLMAMSIGPQDASLSFSRRLALDNDWTVHFSARVEQEYKRFLYLAANCGHAVTPSDEVDQAWHLHLAYSRHYWDVLCGSVLKRPLHHGPTEGGSQENSRYREQYLETLESYRIVFNTEPPSDIWPDAERRFGVRYRRLALGQHWIFPKKGSYALVPLFGLAACTGGNVATGFFVIVVAGILFTIIAGAIGRKADKTGKNEQGGSGCSTGSGCGSSGGDSGCGSGCGGGGCGS